MYHQRVFILTEAPEQCFCRDIYVGFMVLPGRTLLYIVIVGVLIRTVCRDLQQKLDLLCGFKQIIAKKPVEIFMFFAKK